MRVLLSNIWNIRLNKDRRWPSFCSKVLICDFQLHFASAQQQLFNLSIGTLRSTTAKLWNSNWLSFVYYGKVKLKVNKSDSAPSFLVVVCLFRRNVFVERIERAYGALLWHESPQWRRISLTIRPLQPTKPGLAVWIVSTIRPPKPDRRWMCGRISVQENWYPKAFSSFADSWCYNLSPRNNLWRNWRTMHAFEAVVLPLPIQRYGPLVR